MHVIPLYAGGRGDLVGAAGDAGLQLNILNSSPELAPAGGGCRRSRPS